MVISAAFLFAMTQTLVGDWAIVNAHRDASMPVEECATDHGLSYAADGSWRTFFGDESGNWESSGTIVRERVTHRYDDVRGDRAVRERSYRLRLHWLSADHVNVVKGREKHGLIRCPVRP